MLTRCSSAIQPFRRINPSVDGLPKDAHHPSEEGIEDKMFSLLLGKMANGNCIIR